MYRNLRLESLNKDLILLDKNKNKTMGKRKRRCRRNRRKRKRRRRQKVTQKLESRVCVITDKI